MRQFLKAGTGLVMLFSSDASAEPLSRSEISLNLRYSCSDLKSQDGVKDCQQAFAIAAENIVTTQKNMLLAPHYERVGLKDDPESVLVTTPAMLAAQLTGFMNGSCKNIASKKQRDPDSARLDDGTMNSLHRIAERAIQCVHKIEIASQVAKVPVPTSLIKNLEYNAENVRALTNRIAMAY